MTHENVFQENPEETARRGPRRRWDHHLTGVTPERRIHVGGPSVNWRARLVGGAWVLTRTEGSRVSSDTRGRVVIPIGVAWRLGIDEAAVVSTDGAGTVVVRSARVLDPSAGEETAWSA